MATTMKRLMVSINPELEPELASIKKEYFYNSSNAEMLRYLIKRGLMTVAEEQKAGLAAGNTVIVSK